jgi:hypothetical protein
MVYIIGKMVPLLFTQMDTKNGVLNGKEITEEINDWAKERNIDLNDMSDMDKMVLKIEIKMWK